MKVIVEMSEKEVLDAIEPHRVSEYFKNHRDISDLLRVIGVPAIASFLREESKVGVILDELAQVDDIEAHITELRAWVIKQKQQKEVG